MRIGILGNAADLQVQAVAEALNNLGVTPVILSPGAIESGRGFALLDGEFFLDDDALGDVRAWWVRSLPSPFVTGKELAGVTPEQAFERQTQTRERVQIAMSWLLELDDLGVAIVNPPRSGINFIAKPYQLSLMRRAGVPVPRTLYTSSPAAARAFRAEVGPCIVKPIAGGAHTRDFDEESVQASLHLIRGAPIVVQERAFGEHLRITVVGGEIVSAVVIESQELDYRDDPEYHHNAKYREANLSSDGLQIALAAAHASQLVYTGIDILRRGENHVVLECNTSPIYLDIERRMGHPISSKLAQYLCDRAEGSR